MRGRSFSPQDREGAALVVIAGDVHRSGLREEPSLQYYVPIGQERDFQGAALLVRPNHRGAIASATLQRAIVSADPSLVGVDLQPLSAALDGQIRPFQLGMVTFTLSGVLALLVAGLGLYSLMAYTVAWRTHEIGVRMAMGATEAQVARLVVGTGAALTTASIVAGLGLAFSVRQSIQPRLFNTSASDPGVFLGVAAALLLVSLAAGWIPARRATRISPTEALRGE